MLSRAILAVGLLVTFPTHAAACGTSPFYAIIHSALPKALPDGLFVAEVEVEASDFYPLYTTGLRARVTKLIAGGTVNEIILRRPVGSSCDAPFANGKSGLVVGIAKQRVGDRLVVWPLLVSRHDGFTLPDGFTPEQQFGPSATP
jgi:hypothetical protein